MMTRADKVQTVVYHDEANEDLSGISRKTTDVGKKFKYIHKNPIWLILEFIVYRIIMLPLAFIYCKIKFHHKIVNRKVLKSCKGKGYFIYGNHTLFGGDAFIPNIINCPRKTYVIVHADNISLPFCKNFLMMSGALPIPTDFHANKNFVSAVEKRIVQHNAVCIYPEAHVWPYCTKIRPMHISSFEYPVKMRDPVFCFTNTFSKKKFGKSPKVTTYIDGPFYPDTNLSIREQEKQLSNQVFEAMQKRTENNTYEKIKYIKANSR